MSDAEILSRIERLESDNRRLKGFGLTVVAILAALGALYAARPSPGKLTAREFDVVDGSGRVRLKLAVAPDGTSFVEINDVRGHAHARMTTTGSGTAAIGIVDSEGRPRAEMELDRAGKSVISIMDTKGHPRAVMAQSSIGARRQVGAPARSLGVSLSGNAGVSLSDADGRPRAQFETWASGEPDLTLYGPHPLDAIAWIALDSSGNPAVRLNAANGEGHAGLAISSSGAPTITLADAQGYVMDLGATNTIVSRTGETQKTSAASIVIFGNDEKHHVIWRAP